MIYWERHHPRFLVSLQNPSGRSFDVWDWYGRPPGWVDSTDLNEDDGAALVFSDPFPTATLSLELRNRLRTGSGPGSGFRHPSHLVNYYYVNDGVCLSLVGATEQFLLQGLNTQAPDWWAIEEDMTPLQRLEERIKVFVETVSQWYHSAGSVTHYPAVLETPLKGYCTKCGLPLDRHVSHTVPGFENMSFFASPAEARPYVAAFKSHYGGALKKMSDAELLEMPLPPNKRNLRVLLLEVQGRIKHPTGPKSAVDRLLGGGLLDE